MTNYRRFRDELERQYIDLFAHDPEYAYAAARTTPAALADKMTAGLSTGAANLDGDGIKRTCKALGLRQTFKAIRPYLATPDTADTVDPYGRL